MSVLIVLLLIAVVFFMITIHGDLVLIQKVIDRQTGWSDK